MIKTIAIIEGISISLQIDQQCFSTDYELFNVLTGAHSLSVDHLDPIDIHRLATHIHGYIDNVTKEIERGKLSFEGQTLNGTTFLRVYEPNSSDATRYSKPQQLQLQAHLNKMYPEEV